MLPRFPLIPTILVAAAVATMIALGIWQLGRAEEKEALIARYSSVDTTVTVPFPTLDAQADQTLYRRSSLTCESVRSLTTAAGKSEAGRSGLAVIASCDLANNRQADVVLGWESSPNLPDWAGGEVSGIIAPGPRLVADPPLADLEPIAKPDPKDLPNNHLAYAGQWFFFALTALIIFVLALKRKQRDESAD